MKKQKISARQIAFSAILVAVTCILLLLSSVFPTMSLTIVAMAGFLPAAAVSSYGMGAGYGIYTAASVLSLLLVPDKSMVAVYIIIFGHYPMLKAAIERLKSKPLRWVIKIVAANILFLLVYLVFTFVFALPITEKNIGLWALLGIYQVAFVLYDVCFSKLIILYNIKLTKHIKF